MEELLYTPGPAEEDDQIKKRDLEQVYEVYFHSLIISEIVDILNMRRVVSKR